MAKTKTEKITDLQEQIKQLKNQRKRLIQEQKQQERKDRTRRLCKRMGLFESLPDIIPLTDEHFKTFLEKAVFSDQSHRILDGLTAQDTATAAPKPAGTARGNATDEGEDEGNGARVTVQG